MFYRMPKKLLSEFEQAFSQLKQALQTPAATDLQKAGCIQYFEFCFELAWKTIRAFAKARGLEPYSPKSTLQEALRLQWITDEKLWLDMLESRNLMTHTYDQSEALDVYESLVDYLRAFEDLLESLKNVTTEKNK